SLEVDPGPLSSPLFPYTTLFRSTGTTEWFDQRRTRRGARRSRRRGVVRRTRHRIGRRTRSCPGGAPCPNLRRPRDQSPGGRLFRDRKSTRLNSSHVTISYAVFCL